MIGFDLVVFSDSRHSQVDKYKLKFRTHIQEAKHNMTIPMPLQLQCHRQPKKVNKSSEKKNKSGIMTISQQLLTSESID